MSQQQNPHEVLQSLLQPDFKPFSMRQYVLASRQKDIYHNWPFPEKYLQICQKHGIKNVLPPLEPHHLAIQSVRGVFHSNGSQQIKENAGSHLTIHQDTVEKEKTNLKEECNLKFDEVVSKICSQDSHLSLSSNTFKHEKNDHHPGSDVASSTIASMDQPPSSLLHLHQCNKTTNSSKRLRYKRKRHKGKGKHKKKSIVDILAVAKPSNLEEYQYRINRLLRGLSKPVEQRVNGIKQMAGVQRECESELTEECLNNELRKDDHECADIDMLGRKRWVLKFKFSGCGLDSSNNTN